MGRLGGGCFLRCWKRGFQVDSFLFNWTGAYESGCFFLSLFSHFFLHFFDSKWFIHAHWAKAAWQSWAFGRLSGTQPDLGVGTSKEPVKWHQQQQQHKKWESIGNYTNIPANNCCVKELKPNRRHKGKKLQNYYRIWRPSSRSSWKHIALTILPSTKETRNNTFDHQNSLANYNRPAISHCKKYQQHEFTINPLSQDILSLLLSSYYALMPHTPDRIHQPMPQSS